MTEEGLLIDKLVVRFGGHTAVNELSMRAPIGKITGLIGPNGAGKTTTFNVCSGAVKPTGGSVTFNGTDLVHAPASRRAHLGIGRTFQRIELYDSMTVRENVSLGREARLAGTSPISQLLPRRGERAACAEATATALAACGIEAIADARAGLLSTGQRRLIELARALAGDFRLLLLDEPSSGLDVSESENFIAILHDVVDRLGVGILIVEHDMTLVMSTCDYLHVLDFGKPIFEGTPRDVAASELVRAAYLGSEAAGLEQFEEVG